MGNPTPAVKSLTAAARPGEAPKTPPNMANKRPLGQVIDFSEGGFANPSGSGLTLLKKTGEFANPHVFEFAAGKTFPGAARRRSFRKRIDKKMAPSGPGAKGVFLWKKVPNGEIAVKKNIGNFRRRRPACSNMTQRIACNRRRRSFRRSSTPRPAVTLPICAAAKSAMRSPQRWRSSRLCA